MIEQPFELQNHGMTIRGMSYLPDAAGDDAARRWPTLLLLHGLGGDRIETANLFVDMGAFLTARDYAVVTFNFRHTPDSDGQLCDVVPTDELSDALVMTDWSRAQPFVDVDRLALLGISLGGLVAACTVARTDAFKCLVLLNPTDVWNMRRIAGLYKDPPGPPFNYGIHTLSERFCDDVATLDPLGDVMKFKGPMLLVQGAKDIVVQLPVSDRYAYSRRRVGLPLDQHVMDIGDHAFGGQAQHARLYPLVGDWLDTHLR